MTTEDNCDKRTLHLHFYTLTMIIPFLQCKKLYKILQCRKLCKICSVEMYVLKVSYSWAANGRIGLFVLWFEYLPSWCPLMMRIPWHSVIVRNLKHEEVQIANIGWKLYLKTFYLLTPMQQGGGLLCFGEWVLTFWVTQIGWQFLSIYTLFTLIPSEFADIVITSDNFQI